MNKRIRTQLTLEFVIDIFCMVLANVLSFYTFSIIINKIPSFSVIDWVRYGGTLLVSYLVVFFGFHTRIDMHHRGRTQEVRALLSNATLTYALFSVLIILLKNPIVESRYMLISGYILFIATSSVGRYALKHYLTGRFTRSKVASLVGIITTSDRAEEFVAKINEDWSLSISGIALLDDFCVGNVFRYSSESANAYGISAPTATAERTAHLPRTIQNIPVIATDETFIDWILSSPLDEVFINLPYGDDSEVQGLIEDLEDMGVTVHVNIPMLDDILGASKFSNISCKMQYDLPMATFTASEKPIGGLIIKRATDIVLGTLGLILSIPVIAITAIPLKRESKGPLFFRQLRMGRNGRPFYIYKLRSMYVDAEERKQELMEQNKMEGLMFKMDDDPRITKVGKFIRRTSIDELPQFFNVVKGDMSLVGTRPPTVDEFNQYENRHKRRLSMRPGISGMWQVSGRSDIQNFEDVVALDCQYIDEWSVWLDIKILFKTVIVVLTHKGAE